MIVEVRTINEP